MHIIKRLTFTNKIKTMNLTKNANIGVLKNC